MSEKAPLKAGDRVRVFGNTQTGELETTGLEGLPAIVQSVHGNGWLQVLFDSGKNFTVHPKQCRRLKLKAKLREFWIQVPVDPEKISFVTGFRPETGTKAGLLIVRDRSRADGWTRLKELIHVREVRRKE